MKILLSVMIPSKIRVPLDSILRGFCKLLINEVFSCYDVSNNLSKVVQLFQRHLVYLRLPWLPRAFFTFLTLKIFPNADLSY